MRHLLPALAIGLSIASTTPTWPATELPYRPTISDLMNDVIQPRHTKLWLAGQAGNWMLAEYERHNINGAFGRIASAIPTVKGAQMADLIATFIAPNLSALADAIKARNQNAFGAAYAALTEGCNECHRSTGYPMVVIQSPSGGPFPDQDFRPGPIAAPSAK